VQQTLFLHAQDYSAITSRCRLYFSDITTFSFAPGTDKGAIGERALLQTIPLAEYPRAAVFTQASSRLEFEFFNDDCDGLRERTGTMPNARSTMRASPRISCVS